MNELDTIRQLLHSNNEDDIILAIRLINKENIEKLATKKPGENFMYTICIQGSTKAGKSQRIICTNEFIFLLLPYTGIIRVSSTYDIKANSLGLPILDFTT